MENKNTDKTKSQPDKTINLGRDQKAGRSADAGREERSDFARGERSSETFSSHGASLADKPDREQNDRQSADAEGGVSEFESDSPIRGTRAPDTMNPQVKSSEKAWDKNH